MYLCFWWGTLFLGYGFWDCLCFSCLFMSVLGWLLTSFYTLDMVSVPLVVNRGDEIRGWWEGICLILEGMYPYCCSGLKFVGRRRGKWCSVFVFFVIVLCCSFWCGGGSFSLFAEKKDFGMSSLWSVNIVFKSCIYSWYLANSERCQVGFTT